MRAVGCDLKSDAGALDAADLPAFRKHAAPERGESADLATENPREHLRLTLVGALVDEEAGGSLGFSRPQITLPSSHPDKAQLVQVDLAGVTLPDVPQ